MTIVQVLTTYEILLSSLHERIVDIHEVMNARCRINYDICQILLM